MTLQRPSTPPPASVAAAFGIDDVPERMSGGNGDSYRAGGLVLKRVRDAREAESICEFTSALPQSGFRLASPIRSRSGGWVVDGWTASTWLAGVHRTDRWPELFSAADAFHAAARSTPLPAFIRDGGWELRDELDRWRYADRVAWGEIRAAELLERPEIRALCDACRPVDVSSQIVHCDLVGNVLFAGGLPPGIIDLSLYWRPIGYSAAIAFADAAVFHGAPPETITRLERYSAWRQLLVRGVLFRVVVNELQRRYRGRLHDDEPFEPIIKLALAANE